MSERELGKVTAFVTRMAHGQRQVLVFRHPNAGIQFPAGTLDPGETPEQAVLRETWEEAGLRDVSISRYLGQRMENPPPDERVMIQRSTIYGRPDTGSFDWAWMPRGAQVQVLRQVPGWTQVGYSEWDREPERNYISMVITGWVPNDALTDQRRRHFFLLDCHEPTADRWQRTADYHRFELFWVNESDIEQVVTGGQAEWLPYFLTSHS